MAHNYVREQFGNYVEYGSYVVHNAHILHHTVVMWYTMHIFYIIGNITLLCTHMYTYTCNKADDHTQVPVLNCNNYRVIGITRLG